MEIVLQIYFAINIFIAGYYTGENLRWESKTYAFISLIFYLLLGGIYLIVYPMFCFVLPKFGWIVHEIKFQYRFRVTDYWDKIILDDNYLDEYKSREEKLKRMIEITKGASKQVQRHQKMIQEKYGESE